MNRILITGGCGFVGSSLALRMRDALPKAEIICLDNLYRKGSDLNRLRLQAVGITFVAGDVRDCSAFELEPCDLVIDAAAEPSVLAGSDGSDVKYVVDTNLAGTLNLLEAARKWSAAFLFLSTSRVYPVQRLRDVALEAQETRLEIAADQDMHGVTVAGVDESFPIDGSRTLYGATKYASEVMVGEYAAQFGVRAVINRCGVIAGPWQMGRVDQGIIALWVAAHVYGKSLKYIGYGGKQVRDILHVEDLADLLLMQLAERDRWNGEVYNVGGGREVSTSLLELTEHCRDATGNTIDIGYDDKVREGDVPLYITDTSKVCDEFGWGPTRKIEAIVEDTAKWIVDHRDELSPVFGG